MWQNVRRFLSTGMQMLPKLSCHSVGVIVHLGPTFGMQEIMNSMKNTFKKGTQSEWFLLWTKYQLNRCHIMILLYAIWS